MDPLKFTIDGNNLSSYRGDLVQEVMNSILKSNRNKITTWLNERSGEVINWGTYEGGIDDWWGLGSVFSYELGIKLTIEFEPICHLIYITLN